MPGGGRRGPPPKPTALKILSGNPGRRPLPENEPKPDMVTLDDLNPPADLPIAGVEKWHELKIELSRLGLLTKIDVGQFEMYCRFWALFKQNMQFIEDKGCVVPIKDSKGRVKQIKKLPHVSIAMEAAEKCISLAREMGMTPAARTRIQVTSNVVDEDEIKRMDNKYFGW